jgi:hypothetical protein
MASNLTRMILRHGVADSADRNWFCRGRTWLVHEMRRAVGQFLRFLSLCAPIRDLLF